MNDSSQNKTFEVVFQELENLAVDDAEIILATQTVAEVIGSSEAVVEELRVLSDLRNQHLREEYYTGT